MHAEFADQRIERHHLGRVVRRHLHRFLGSQDVELAGIEDQAAIAPRLDRLPELIDGVAAAAIDIDHAGMALGAIADKAAGVFAGQIDADRHAMGEIGIIDIDQPLGLMQRVEFAGAQRGFADPEPELRQPRAFAQQHRKGFGADLGIKRAVVTGIDTVEPPGAVGDHAREHVEPAGRAFRIGGGHDIRRQRQALQQRHDVDAVGLQHRAVGEIDLMQLQFVDPFGDRAIRPRQKTGAHPVGDVAEPQIEAGRLDLALDEGIFGADHAGIGHRRNHAVGQNAIGIGRQRERHGIDPSDGGRAIQATQNYKLLSLADGWLDGKSAAD